IVWISYVKIYVYECLHCKGFNRQRNNVFAARLAAEGMLCNFLSVHPHTSIEDLDELSTLLQVPLVAGTVNRGSEVIVAKARIEAALDEFDTVQKLQTLTPYMQSATAKAISRYAYRKGRSKCLRAVSIDFKFIPRRRRWRADESVRSKQKGEIRYLKVKAMIVEGGGVVRWGDVASFMTRIWRGVWWARVIRVRGIGGGSGVGNEGREEEERGLVTSIHMIIAESGNCKGYNNHYTYMVLSLVSLSSRHCIDKQLKDNTLYNFEYEYLTTMIGGADELTDKKIAASHAWVKAVKAQEKEILMKVEMIQRMISELGEDEIERVDEPELWLLLEEH
ncbi:eukaryotic translation initiation factor 6, partial [Tanacetum coccineum]